MSLSQWLREPEFDRWYVKWTALDWIKAVAFGIIMKVAQITYSHFAPAVAGLSGDLLGFVVACMVICLIATLLAVKRKPKITASSSENSAGISLKLRAWYLDRSPQTPTPPYVKSKLWLIFKNEGTEPITVQAPRWAGLPLESRPDKCIQPEIARGTADWDWKHEASQVLIEPGFSFRLWIGFEPKISDAQLAKCRDTRALGTLTIPIKMTNESVDCEYRL